ncbi:cilia- and flagella-associated protein 410-like [Bolinopsis microptera]|uniref:cilia- and flagella-associated protein 410-like n=1 Tax=Bolinopsis microptera TaxID=2820187 RepID=UPI003079D698
MCVLTEELVLSRCRATSLDTIKHINCWGMGLSDISIVQYMTNLEVATFSVNKISTLKFLSFCPKLTELYIRKNDLQSLDELKCLQQLPNLRILWLTENPLCTDNYRQLVLDLLPGIVKLDNVAISPNLNSQASLEQRRKKKSQRPKSAASVDSSFSDAESIIRKSVETPIINAITALLPSLDVEGLYVVRGVIDRKIRNAERSEPDSVSAS